MCAAAVAGRPVAAPSAPSPARYTVRLRPSALRVTDHRRPAGSRLPAPHRWPRISASRTPRRPLASRISHPPPVRTAGAAPGTASRRQVPNPPCDPTADPRRRPRPRAPGPGGPGAWRQPGRGRERCRSGAGAERIPTPSRGRMSRGSGRPRRQSESTCEADWCGSAVPVPSSQWRPTRAVLRTGGDPGPAVVPSAPAPRRADDDVGRTVPYAPRHPRGSAFRTCG